MQAGNAPRVGIAARPIPPDEIVWQELGADQPALDLFDENESRGSSHAFSSSESVSRPRLARVACIATEARWALLYRVLWRLTHGEPQLLEIVVDPDAHALEAMEKAIRRDVHKMRAFVRFREVKSAQMESWFVAWFEPAHHIVKLNAPFFRRPFRIHALVDSHAGCCAHWDGSALSFTPGVSRADAPTGDDVENLWLTYYANIFNPARVKMHAMQAEMPKKYWSNLPEAAAIPALLQRGAAARRNHDPKKQSKDRRGR